MINATILQYSVPLHLFTSLNKLKTNAKVDNDSNWWSSWVLISSKFEYNNINIIIIWNNNNNIIIRKIRKKISWNIPSEYNSNNDLNNNIYQLADYNHICINNKITLYLKIEKVRIVIQW
jgi:hypothetical protein